MNFGTLPLSGSRRAGAPDHVNGNVLGDLTAEFNRRLPILMSPTTKPSAAVL